MDVALRLLGPPTVVVDGRWEALPCALPEAAFFYLACGGGRVRRAKLATLLWPDAEERCAYANLRQTLRTLASRPWGIHLQRDRFTAWVAVASDLDAFDRAVEQRRWADAHAHYAGPLLDGFELGRSGEFGAWLESERAAVAGRWRRATLAWLEETRAARRWLDVLAACDRLLAADPLDEDALRWALEAAAAVGDVHGVERRYASFRIVLQHEIGLEPDATTEALADDLLEGRRGRRAAGGPVAPASGRDPGSAVAERVAHGAPFGPRRPIGRDADLEALTGLVLGDAGRLVTLLAPGGMGKTTLAAAAVETLRPAYGDAVAAVALDRVEGPDAVAHAIGRATGVRLDASVGFVAQLVAGLHGRRLLLWLDGFEPHLDQADLLAELVARCPGLHVLVTSRARLGLAAETVVSVGPLATADEEGGASEPHARSPSAQLFLSAAARAAGRASPGHLEPERVERVCRLLGGHPLAIELVAAWTPVMPLAVLEERVEHLWELLRAGVPGGRSTDLEGVLWETWEGLAHPDREGWARLAVLPGTIERALAAEVAGGWTTLRQLTDRAVVGVQEGRIGLHALLARFGRERAAELGLVEPAWASALAVWRERLEAEIDPVSGRRVQPHPHDLDQAVGAWEHALAAADWDAVTRMAIGLLRGLQRVGRQRERIACAQLAVAALRGRSGPAVERAFARVAAFVHAPVDRRLAAISRASRLARRRRDGRAFALAEAARYRLDASRAADAAFERARSAYERSGDTIGLAALLHDHGERQMLKGYVAEAEASLWRAHELYVQLGDGLGQALALDILTTGPLYRGDADEAARIAAEARALYEAEGAAYRGDGTLATEAWIAFLTGPPDRILERAEAYARSVERYGGLALDVAVVRCNAFAAVGDWSGVAREAGRILESIGAEDHPAFETVLAHHRLAWSLARLGRTDEAARHLAAELALCRVLGAPRMVARAAASAGVLAVATGWPGEAAALFALAWHHPMQDQVLLDQLQGPLQALGVSLPPPRPPDEALADEAVLGRIDALLSDVGGATPG